LREPTQGHISPHVCSWPPPAPSGPWADPDPNASILGDLLPISATSLSAPPDTEAIRTGVPAGRHAPAVVTVLLW